MTDEGKQGRILDAAMKLINQFGFDKTTVGEIAKEAGIAKGTIYLYFKSKDEIYYALLARESNKLKEELVPKLQAAPNPLEQVRLFLMEVGTVPLNNSFALQTFKKDYLRKLNGYSHSDVGKQHGEEGVQFLAAMIQKGIDQGVFRKMDPVKVAMVMYSDISSLTMIAVFMEDLYTLDEVKEMVKVNVDLILNGLAKGDK